MRYLYILSILLIISCQPKKTPLTAQQIIDKTIVASGTEKVANATITYKFRNRNYKAIRNNGKFELRRSFDSITDILNNDGFLRLINGKKVSGNDSIFSNYKNSVNSVHYFSVLPFGLNDKAVRKKLLSSSKINNRAYHKIEITFTESGGGEDYEDVFIYWIAKDNFLIDYLAYSYHTNGGGKRFRVLKEQCNRNGIRFVDYHNYKTINSDIKLTKLDKAFEENQLKKVSEIILEDITVDILE